LVKVGKLILIQLEPDLLEILQLYLSSNVDSGTQLLVLGLYKNINFQYQVINGNPEHSSTISKSEAMN